MIYGATQVPESLRHEWRGLMRDCARPLMFCGMEWASAWMQAFGQDKRLVLVAVHDEDRLVALAPLVRSRMRRRPSLFGRYEHHTEDLPLIRRPLAGRIPMRQLCPMANLESVNMRGHWLLRRGFEESGTRAILSTLAAIGDWDILLLPSIPRAETAGIVAEAQAAGLRALVRPALRALFAMPVVPWERFLTDRGGHFRKRHKRAWRDTRALGQPSLETATDPERSRTLLDEVFALWRRGWKHAGREDQDVVLPLSISTERFYRSLCEHFARHDRGCWITTLRLNQALVGAMLCVAEGATLYGLQTHYDPVAASVSPGRLLFEGLITAAAANAIERIDLNGNSALARRFGCERTLYDQVILFSRGPYSSLLYGACGLCQTIGRRGADPSSPEEALSGTVVPPSPRETLRP